MKIVIAYIKNPQVISEQKVAYYAYDTNAETCNTVNFIRNVPESFKGDIDIMNINFHGTEDLLSDAFIENVIEEKMFSEKNSL